MIKKILLATTALVGFVAAGAAQAATSPLNVTVGGNVDFVAANFADQNHGGPTAGTGFNSANRDFESVYGLNFSVAGKAGNGLEYGGNLGLSNADDISNNFGATAQTSPYMNAANVFMSGAFGKVVLGDSHGATDLVVGAPSVGEGQTTGRYVDFLATSQFAKTFVYGVDGTDHSTNVTYFTPKVGNDSNKVQLGVSYIPQFYNYGSSVVTYNSGAVGNVNTLSPYHDVVKGALSYTGKIAPVAVAASAHIITGSSDQTAANSAWTANAGAVPVQGFTAWGIGAQGALDGFTLGATYADNGHYNATNLQNKDQHQYGAGLKYEFSKVGVSANYLGGVGYDNLLTTAGGAGSTLNYVKDFNSYGLGGSYTWAPGLTSNVDGVLFDQRSEADVKNDGYVLLVSQKLAF